MREEWVLPAPPWPGVVQSVPPEVPKAMLLPDAACEIVPQLPPERKKLTVELFQ